MIAVFSLNDDYMLIINQSVFNQEMKKSDKTKKEVIHVTVLLESDLNSFVENEAHESKRSKRNYIAYLIKQERDKKAR